MGYLVMKKWDFINRACLAGIFTFMISSQCVALGADNEADLRAAKTKSLFSVEIFGSKCDCMRSVFSTMVTNTGFTFRKPVDYVKMQEKEEVQKILTDSARAGVRSDKIESLYLTGMNELSFTYVDPPNNNSLVVKQVSSDEQSYDRSGPCALYAIFNTLAEAEKAQQGGSFEKVSASWKAETKKRREAFIQDGGWLSEDMINGDWMTQLEVIDFIKELNHKLERPICFLDGVKQVEKDLPNLIKNDMHQRFFISSRNTSEDCHYFSVIRTKEPRSKEFSQKYINAIESATSLSLPKDVSLQIVDFAYGEQPVLRIRDSKNSIRLKDPNTIAFAETILETKAPPETLPDERSLRVVGEVLDDITQKIAQGEKYPSALGVVTLFQKLGGNPDLVEKYNRAIFSQF